MIPPSLCATLRRLAVLVVLPALVGQGALTHLHAVSEASGHLSGASHRSDVAPSLGAVPEPGDPAHERGACPLCVARAESRAPGLATSTAPTVVIDDATLPPLASRRPPARPAQRMASLRGPPAAV